MKCYNCGFDLSENDFCTACGADVGIYKKILRLSNRYYNDGLRKAQVRDLSGAVESLKQSLKCNKYNTEARNLLGLVYFEMGEAVDAISEWVLSKNFQPDKNIADNFLNEVQSNPSKWDNVRQTIRKYNQALDYCRQDSNDLAIIQLKSLLKMNPNIVKGHQLLALLYMQDEEWERARRSVMRAQRIDTNNTTTLLYAQEIENAILARDEQNADGPRKKKKKREDIITYQSGNDTIIQPLNHPEHVGGATVVNILIGLVIGLAIMWYLVLPARIQKAQTEVNKDMLEVSNQLTEKSASMDEIQKRTDALEKENAELLSQVQSITGGDGLMQASDILMSAARRYIDEPEAVVEIADSIADIDPVYLTGDGSSSAFQSLYQTLHDTVSTKASAVFLEKGLDSLKDEAYQDAIDELSRAYELDSENVEALYNLGHAYRKNDQLSKSKEIYNQVVTLFADTEYAKNSKQYLDGEEVRESNDNDNASESADNNDNQPEATVMEEPQVVLPDVIPDVTTQMPTENTTADTVATDEVATE